MSEIFDFSVAEAERNDKPESSYNDRELSLRNRFVQEYLIDYDQVAACIRLGFFMEQATEYARKLMGEPYVQREISRLQVTDFGDSPQELSYHKTRIKNQLFREANYRGPGSSQAARVAALKTLGQMFGMEAPTKTETTHKVAGGVMAVPVIADVDAWEAAATVAQANLTNG